MKRIELRMNEQEKYEVIKSLVDHNGNKNAAAIKLGCTVRTINRMIQRYKEQGKNAFVHGNRGRKPAHTLSETTVTDIITLYNKKYYDATFSYACELLAEHDGIRISPSTLTKIMYSNYITSPRTTKTVRKRIAQQLRESQKKTTSKKKKEELQAAIVATENAHPRRPRAAYFGEMIQMDCITGSASKRHNFTLLSMIAPVSL